MKKWMVGVHIMIAFISFFLVALPIAYVMMDLLPEKFFEDSMRFGMGIMFLLCAGFAEAIYVPAVFFYEDDPSSWRKSVIAAIVFHGEMIFKISILVMFFYIIALGYAIMSLFSALLPSGMVSDLICGIIGAFLILWGLAQENIVLKKLAVKLIKNGFLA
jgi:hypothetical protein